MVYALTDAGRAAFTELLCAVLCSFAPVHAGVDVAVVFLSALPGADAVRLLQERRRVVAEHRTQVADELGATVRGPLPAALAADHLVSLIDAELAWVDRALQRLDEAGWSGNTAAADIAGEGSGHGE